MRTLEPFGAAFSILLPAASNAVATDSTSPWCSPSPEIANEITELRFSRENCRWEDGETQRACLQATRPRILEFAASRLEDVVAQRLAQNWAVLSHRDDDAETEAFREAAPQQYGEQPESAAEVHLATRIRRPDAEEALERFRSALELDPDFPWPHYAIATTSLRLASEAARASDAERAAGFEVEVAPHLMAFLQLCPDQLREPLRIAPGFGGPEAWEPRMGRLREVLLASPPEVQTALSLALWRAESAILGPVVFNQLGEQIGDDLARIRAFDFHDHLEWWNTLIEGAKIAGNDGLLSDMLAKLRKVAPCTEVVTHEDRQALRQVGNPSDPEVVRRQLERLNELVARCPDNFSFAVMRIAALWGVDELSDEKVIDTEGATRTQADLIGRTGLINFWTTWSGPCLTELPYVQKIHDRIADRDDVLVLAFNADSWNNARDPAQVLPFLEKHDDTMPVLFAEDSLRQVIGRSVPPTAIVDSKGTVRWWKAGFSSRYADAWVADTVAKIHTLAVPTDNVAP